MTPSVRVHSLTKSAAVPAIRTDRWWLAAQFDPQGVAAGRAKRHGALDDAVPVVIPSPLIVTVVAIVVVVILAILVAALTGAAIAVPVVVVPISILFPVAGARRFEVVRTENLYTIQRDAPLVTPWLSICSM